MADDFGFQPAAPSNDLGFQPAPKIPDTSAVQNMAQKNLAAPTEGEGEPKILTPAQKLDTAAGMPVSAALKGNAPPLTPEWRGHLVDSYKNGTSTNAGDFMQTMLHSIVPIAARGIIATEGAYQPFKPIVSNILEAFKSNFEQTGQSVWEPYNEKNVPWYMVPADVTAKSIGKVGNVIGGAVGTLFAPLQGQATAGLENVVPYLAKGLKELAGGDPRFQNIDKMTTDQVHQVASDIAGWFTMGAGAAYGRNAYEAQRQFSPGAGPWDNHPGADIVKGIIDKDDPNAVSSSQIDEHIAQGFSKSAPAAQDFHDVAQAMQGTSSLTSLPQDIFSHRLPERFVPSDNYTKGLKEYSPIVFRQARPDSAMELMPHSRIITNPGEVYLADNSDMATGQYGNKGGLMMAFDTSSLKGRINKDKPAWEPAWQQGFGEYIGRYNNQSDYQKSLMAVRVPNDLSVSATEKAMLRHTLEAMEKNGWTKTNGDGFIEYRRPEAPPSASMADTLHTIYAETGLRPDQVFEDAQRDPSIKEDIGAGKFPAAYEHLKDTRPPIPDEVKSAMEGMDKLSKEQPPVDLSKEGASKSNNPFVKIFNPAGMSESARDMATALRQGRGPENRDIAVIQEAMKKYAKTFAKMSDADRLEFINYVETRSEGGKLSNPQLQEAADKIKEVYAQVAAKIQERFPDVGLRRDYFTHQYEDQAAADKFFSDWIAKQGSERSLKTRAFPTLKEAMEAGLKPKTTNPIETVMNYVTNMGNLFAAHRSIELAQEMGIADYFRKGQQPTGWEPLNGNLGEKDGKILYAPEDAARVYGNDISEGVTGPAGDILQSVNRVNNFGNMLVLSASMFHFTVTTLSSMAQDVGRALTSGTILERGKNLAQAVTPLANTLKGDKYMQASLYPEAMKELSPELQSAINKAWENNAVNLRNQDYWKAGPAKDYFDIFKNGGVAEEISKARDTLQEHKITGPVRVLANEVGRVMNTISHPLMDTYIPRIKFSATIENIHAWLKSHPDATPEQIDRAVQDIGNNSDNAFGEMMRDNLFWHKITQQTLQTAFLSYSWITGALRMAGKGVPDIGKAIIGKQELTADAKYLLGMAATYTIANGVMTYLKTDQPPDEPMDAVAYKTGGLTKEGKPERAFIPSHFPQYWHYLHDGIGEFGNEASPTLKLVYHLLKNRDWRDLPITNENNSWFDAQKWGDYGKYVLGEETPIGIKSLLQGRKKGSNITDLEKFMGIRATPRQFTDPEGYAEMMRHVNDTEYKKKERSDRKIQSQYENPDGAE